MSNWFLDWFSGDESKDLFAEDTSVKIHFFDGLMEAREELYQQNFFNERREPEVGFRSDPAPLEPTPIAKQYLFFNTYEKGEDESGYQPLHDFYSIIYKPIALSLSSLALLGMGLVFAVRAVEVVCRLVTSLIPINDITETLPEQNEGLLELLAKTATSFASAAVLLAIFLPLDTLSAVTLFVTRSMATIYQNVSEGIKSMMPEKEEASVEEPQAPTPSF